MTENVKQKPLSGLEDYEKKPSMTIEELKELKEDTIKVLERTLNDFIRESGLTPCIDLEVVQGVNESNRFVVGMRIEV